jgi:hypothetical protein
MTRVFAYVCEPWSDSGRGMTWAHTRFAFGMGVFGALLRFGLYSRARFAPCGASMLSRVWTALATGRTRRRGFAHQIPDSSV